MADFIPSSIDELYEIRDYGIINDTELNRLLGIMLGKTPKTPNTPSADTPSILDSEPLFVDSESEKEDPDFVIGTTEVENNNGTITRTINSINSDGQKVQTVQTVKRTTRSIQVPRRVIERRSIIKFGSCAGKPPGPEPGITGFGDIVFFETPSAESKDELSKKKESMEKKIDKASLIVCRKCGEPGHWTMHCPHNEQTLSTMKKITSEAFGSSESEGGEETGKYIPPSRRKRGDGDDSNDSESKTNLRISNLDEDANNNDLKDLFGRFGRLKSARVITDRHTGQSRGFAYVDYENEDDAQAALDKLQGYAYGNQILRLEWAKPRRR